MKKQLITVAAGIILVVVLFVFGKTTREPTQSLQEKDTVHGEKSFDIETFITDFKKSISPSRAVTLSKMENGISRGDVVSQQIKAYQSLAAYWKDSLNSFEPYAYYISAAAKLDNSEKNLTFAARLFLDNLRSEADEIKLKWETEQAISLFEGALKINPENDDLRIGLGSCYIYGKGRSGNAQETMQGIQELLKVVRKDSTNMKAQMVLGVGGMVSGQYEKALERFKKVVEAEPGNVEAVAFLADAYAAKGEKEEAIKWYTVSKRLVNNPHYSEEVDQRIKTLK